MKSAINKKIKLGLWWSKVGKWQVMATVITLVTYFFTSYFTGNKDVSIATAAIIAIAFAFAFDITAFAIAFATIAFATIVYPSAIIAIAFFIAFAVIAVAIAIKNNKATHGISKIVIYLSYMAEFIIIFLSMLILIRR